MPAAAGAAVGAEIEHPVGSLDDFEIMLDHDHGVAGLDQAMQHFEQLAHVLEMQAGGRLVEDVERPAGSAARQFLCELHALGFAARQGRRLLADMDIAQPDLLQGQQLLADHRHGLEEFDAFVDRQLQHVGDRLAAESISRVSRL